MPAPAEEAVEANTPPAESSKDVHLISQGFGEMLIEVGVPRSTADKDAAAAVVAAAAEAAAAAASKHSSGKKANVKAAAAEAAEGMTTRLRSSRSTATSPAASSKRSRDEETPKSKDAQSGEKKSR